MSRRRSRRDGRPSGPAIRALDYALADLRRALNEARVHASRARRVAVTFGRDGDGPLGDDPVPLPALRLAAMHVRQTAPAADGRRARLPLAVYAPAIDLPGTGRIGFEPVAIRDAALAGGDAADGLAIQPGHEPRLAADAAVLAQALEDADEADFRAAVALPPIYFAFPAGRPPVFEAATPPAAWAAAEVRIGGMRAWPAELFARRRWEEYATHPVDGSPRPDPVAPQSPDCIVGGWALRDGDWYPACQEPAAVFALPGGDLAGRVIRNPAALAMRCLGVIDPRQSYKAFLARMAPRTDAGRVPHDSAESGTPTYRFLDDVSALATRVGDGVLAVAIRAASEAMGAPIPLDDDAEVLRRGFAPWTPVAVPGAAAVQVVRLAGMPAPGRMTWTVGAADLDLYDLGPAFAAIDPSVAHPASGPDEPCRRRRRRRGGRRHRKAGPAAPTASTSA